MNDLIKLAKYAGGRFDLTQTRGGNISLKQNDGTLLIKISGIAMSEIEHEQHFAKIQIDQLLPIAQNAQLLAIEDKNARERYAQQLLASANLTPQLRPSIEVFLHPLLYRYTLHTHPLTVNYLVVLTQAKQIVSELFPDSLWLDYFTPGIELAMPMAHAVNDYQHQHGCKPKIVFLKNHGVIVSSDDADEVQAILERITLKIERYLQIDHQVYRVAHQIADLVNALSGLNQVAHCSDDAKIAEIYQNHPHFVASLPPSPDIFVFAGLKACVLNALTSDAIANYFQRYHHFPKVIVYQEKFYFLHQTTAKAKEIEEMYKFHLMVLAHAPGPVESLSENELAYLGQWEAEKYRQKV